jgi:hypothetical protein
VRPDSTGTIGDESRRESIRSIRTLWVNLTAINGGVGSSMKNQLG